MELKIGSAVRSKAGRDKGRLMAVVSIGEKSVEVCDGKERRLEKPKKKNPLHLAPTKAVIDTGAMATNRSLKKALAALEQQNDRTMEG